MTNKGYDVFWFQHYLITPTVEPLKFTFRRFEENE